MSNKVPDEIYNLAYLSQPSIIFMGNGLESLGRCYKLIQELIDAFGSLSGMQQPTHFSDEEDSKTYNSNYWHKQQLFNQRNNMILAARIAMALTGKKIKFEE